MTLSLVDRHKLEGKEIIASVSGGKDSAAMSLFLRENDIPHRRVFLDTGWEHPLTYEYLRGPLTQVLGPIEEVRSEGMVALVKRKGMFPSRLRRFCTEELKVKPMQQFLAGLDDPINVVGIRAAESAARAKMPAWEWANGMDCWTWRPLIAWSSEDVVAIHKRHGLVPNPLYLEGATRVGCWPCIYATKQEVALVAKKDPERVNLLRILESEVTASARARNPDTGPRGFFQARIKDENGKSPVWSIDQTVEWATTDLGRGVPDMDALARDGCMRWGLCSTEEEKP